MRAHAALIGLLVGLTPGPAHPAPSEPATGRASDEQAVRAAALRLHEERRYSEAAALLERLAARPSGSAAAETDRGDLLFDAGQSRFAAGHRAHALRLWQAYADSPGRDAEDIALASRRIADARALTAPITLIVHVFSDMSVVTVTIRRLHDPADAERPAITLDDLRAEAAARTAVVNLDPGVWELVASVPGAVPARHELIVGRAPQTAELTLAAPPLAPPRPIPRPIEAVQPVGRPRIAAALLPVAAASVAAGTALTIVATRAFTRDLGRCQPVPVEPSCNESALLADTRQTSAGAGLVGAAVGLAAAAVTALVPARTGRQRVWVIEMIVGGAALAVSAGWLAGEHVAYGRARGNDDYLARIGPWFDRRAIAASLLGAGLGLAAGAAAGRWLPPRRRARVAWRPALGLTGAGLVAVF